MANIYGQIGIRFEDDSNEVTSMPMYFYAADTTTLAQLATDVGATEEIIANLSDAAAVKLYALVQVPLGETGTPAVGSRIESTALFRCLAANGFVRHQGIDLPAPKSSILLSESKKVDLTNLAVQAFMTMIAEGQGHLHFTSPTGIDVAEVLSGRQTFRKHRRVANRS